MPIKEINCMLVGESDLQNRHCKDELKKGDVVMAAAKKTVKPVAVAKVEAPKAEKAVESVENKVETPAEEVKTTEVKAEKPAEKAAPAAKKETVKKETKASAKKTAGRKASTKKTELKSEVHIEFSGKSYTQEDLVRIAKDVWKYDLKQKAGDLTSVEVYVKPEENVAYYVMNGQFTGSFII